MIYCRVCWEESKCCSLNRGDKKKPKDKKLKFLKKKSIEKGVGGEEEEREEEEEEEEEEEDAAAAADDDDYVWINS
jgi:hypothetical protein